MKKNLASLIKLCGDNFYALYRSKNKGTNEEWVAHTNYRWLNTFKVINSKEATDKVAFGRTPEEAVKNLYLILKPERGKIK